MKRDKLLVALMVYGGLGITAYGLSTIDTEIVIPSTVYAVMITVATVGLLILFVLSQGENDV